MMDLSRYSMVKEVSRDSSFHIMKWVHRPWQSKWRGIYLRAPPISFDTSERVAEVLDVLLVMHGVTGVPGVDI